MARVQTHLNLRETREQLEREKRLVDSLLDNILPAAAVIELKATGSVAPKRFENVAVLFVDLVSFTSYCNQHTPEEVVGSLSDLFVLFEECASRYGLEKIKTVGDAFLATAGLLNPVLNPLAAAVNCALEIAAGTPGVREGWRVRAGRTLRTGNGRHRGPGAISIRHLGRYRKRCVAPELGGFAAVCGAHGSSGYGTPRPESSPARSRGTQR